MPQKCRDCKWWVPIPPWQGNCKLHPSSKPEWSESATPIVKGCQAYEEKVPAAAIHQAR